MLFKFIYLDWFVWVFIISNNIYFYFDENEFYIFSWIKYVVCYFWFIIVYMIIYVYNKMNKNEVLILKLFLVKLVLNIFVFLNF